MDGHGQRVTLLQALHTLEQQNYQATALDCLDGPGQKVGSDCLEVLQDAHAVRVAQDAVRVLVVGIGDRVEREEDLEGIFEIRLSNSPFDLLPYLGLALLPVAREAQEVLLVGPQQLLVVLDVNARHDVVKVDDDIFGAVADDDDEAPLLLLECW